MGSERIYADHAATTAMHPDVLQEMLPYFLETYGNPSSIHGFGRDARQAVDDARRRIARCLRCTARELIFTSGGTESNNLAIRGVVGDPRGKHIITTAVEHHAVLLVCRELEARGAEVTYLPVDRFGAVNAEDCAQAIRKNTVLISVMFGNNEVGTLQPIVEIGALARENRILFHSDAVQAFGHVELDLTQLPVDLLTVSAHKLAGPKGCGLLYVREGIGLQAQQAGGSQERQRRAGTENVPAIVGFAKAAELATESISTKRTHMVELREFFIQRLTESLGSQAFVVNGHSQQTLAHIVNLSFPGIPSALMLMNLDLAGVAVSAGSACTAGAPKPSHVLQAMNLPQDIQESAIRFSFSMHTDAKKIDIIVKKLETIYQRGRIL